MPGWGIYPYGTSPWATGLSGPVEIPETVGVSEAVALTLPLRVVSATALSPFLVQVEFGQALDFGYAPVLNTANYSTVPILGISSVAIGPTSSTVWLTTDQLTQPIYTLTVADARSSVGDTLDPAHRTAIFAGFGTAPVFFASAQSRTKIQLVFSTEMEQNAAIVSAGSYQVTDLNLTPITVTSATIYGPTPAQRVTLELDSEMVPGGYYVVQITNPGVKTVGGLNLNPTYDMFQWGEMQTPMRGIPISIDISNFSGEVSGGLLGQPLGQIFFSPALEAAIANSTIQVDSVSCCTRAYDTYTMPSLPDPEPLMTWGPNQTYSATLGNNVLWATADRLGLAQVNLSDLREDTVAAPVDGPADAILQETFDQSRVSLLNVSTWTLYDGVGTPFSTADNLTPVPAGTTTNISLQP